MNHKEALTILGLYPEASPQEIKARFRELSVKYHPDHNPDQTEEDVEAWSEIEKAYAFLTKKKPEEVYDVVVMSILVQKITEHPERYHDLPEGIVDGYYTAESAKEEAEDTLDDLKHNLAHLESIDQPEFLEMLIDGTKTEIARQERIIKAATKSLETLTRLKKLFPVEERPTSPFSSHPALNGYTSRQFIDPNAP